MNEPTRELPLKPKQFLSADLAQFAISMRAEDIPADVRIRAKHLILDAIGIAYASTGYDFAHRTISALCELGAGDQPVIGMSARLNLRDSVVMNGLLIHGLDYDDTHVPGVIHATASCLPTALGVAAHARLSGQELLAAYVTGMEVAARLGAVAKGGFHQVGFHPTGLVGAFACTLIVGKLYGMSPQQMVMAQGIALSVGAGSLEFLQDGAWTKRLHPGWAGAAAITAATLARHGFVGPAAAYEGRFGLYASHLGPLAEQCDYALATEGLGTTWEIHQVGIKPIPACHFTHACTDAARHIHRIYGLKPEEIKSVRALVPKEVVKTVCEPVANKRQPANSYDAQFSIPYTVATALLHGSFDLTALEDARLRDPAVLALAAKVAYEVDPAAEFPRYYSGEVIVTTHDGRELRHREHINRGSIDRPISNADIIVKFMENMQTVVSRARAEEVRDQVLALDQAGNAAELLNALAARH